MGGVMAHNPCIHRIPKLKVKHVSFLYGVNDWMDVQGGLDVQRICRQQKQQQSQGNDNNNNNIIVVPEIDVYKVKDAGHLLMLENSKGFNAAVIIAGGGGIDTIEDKSQLPICVDVSSSSSPPPPSPPIADNVVVDA